jgi:tRNA (guanine37-N1)-methyltransferase
MRCIVDDEASKVHKLLILSEKFSGFDDGRIPPVLKTFLATHSKETIELKEYTLELGYDNLDAYTVLKSILPDGVDVPSSFEQCGHIIHLNLRDEQLPYKESIGQVILDKNHKRARTVVNKVSSIATQFRTFPMEVLAGDTDMVVEVKESGCRFTFDYSAVYWNSRLGTEHGRLVDLLKPSDVVCDMFAGIGPFSVPAAAKGCEVHANDLNPYSYKYLVENIATNKVERRAKAYNLDGRDFVRQLVSDGVVFNHVFMNLPADAISFLDVFRGIFHSKRALWGGKLPRIHTHCFEKPADGPATVIRRTEETIGASIDRESTIVHRVRNVSPNKEMYCISFTLPDEAAFATTPNPFAAKLLADKLAAGESDGDAEGEGEGEETETQGSKRKSEDSTEAGASKKRKA